MTTVTAKRLSKISEAAREDIATGEDELQLKRMVRCVLHQLEGAAQFGSYTKDVPSSTFNQIDMIMVELEERGFIVQRISNHSVYGTVLRVSW